MAPAPLDSAQKVQAAVQARQQQQREAQLALERRALTGANASTSGALSASPLLAACVNSLSVNHIACSDEHWTGVPSLVPMLSPQVHFLSHPLV